MWESLATTRRQDRVLHGSAKLLNVLIGIVALPVWLLGQRLGGPLRRMLERRGERPRELPVPAGRERSMSALMADLEAIPSRVHASPWAEARKGLADMSTFVLTQSHDLATYGYAYPRQFHELTFDSPDGVRIGASVALHDVPRPALIVVHGLF